MSVYSDLVDEFFTRYDYPVIEPFIMGFSGIDPPLKQSVGFNDHELLNNIKGGDSDNGHYHLTLEQLNWIIEQMSEKYPPDISPNQVVHGIADVPLDDFEIQGTDVRP